METSEINTEEYYKRGYLKLEPSENTLIQIMNNNQVDENTAFFD